MLEVLEALLEALAMVLEDPIVDDNM